MSTSTCAGNKIKIPGENFSCVFSRVHKDAQMLTHIVRAPEPYAGGAGASDDQDPLTRSAAHAQPPPFTLTAYVLLQKCMSPDPEVSSRIYVPYLGVFIFGIFDCFSHDECRYVAVCPCRKIQFTYICPHKKIPVFVPEKITRPGMVLGP